MTDLEHRLRDDAARRDADEPELLDLDEALDFAVHDDKHARTRRSALRWAAAAAAVVVVAGVAAALVWKSPDPGPAGSSGPATLRQGGHTYSRHQVPAVAVFQDPAAGAMVDVFVMAGSGSNDPRCNLLRPAVRVVGESGPRVTLAATVYQVSTTGTFYCGYAGPLFQRLHLRLARPLGGREVVNAADGTAIGVIDPRGVSAPTHVPAGFAAGAVSLPDPTTADLDAIRTYTRGQNTLTVAEQPAAELTTSTSPPDAVTTVAGHRAEVRTESGGRCIVWPVRPGIDRRVCVDGPTLGSVSEQLAVARSVP